MSVLSNIRAHLTKPLAEFSDGCFIGKENLTLVPDIKSPSI